MKNQNGVSMLSLVITIIVILILSAIVFLTSLRTIGEADYSKYVSNVSDVSAAFYEASSAVNGQKMAESKTKSIDQVYNYVAKDGVEEIDFLPRSEVPTYTIIKDNGQIGIALPEMILESGTGKRIPVKYATTKGGQIFTWPPYDYEGNLHITDTDTVEDKLQTQITVGNEKFQIKLDEDGALVDLPENWYEDDEYVTPDEPIEHVHDFSSKTPTSTYLHTEATCTESAVYYYKCTGCTEKGTETYSEGLPLGHSFSEYTIVKTPNCTETGISQGTCIRCNQFSNADVPVDPNNHHGTETPVVTKEPTCKELGVKTYHCSSCNAELRTESIDLVDHSFGPFVTTKEATCKEKGERTKYCSGCGKTEKEEIPIDTTRHYGSEVPDETEKANCGQKGLLTFTCSLCGQVTKTEETAINPNNHDGAETETETDEATCTGTGEIIEKCSRCKTKLNSIETPALGHSWNAAEPPRKCNRCGLEENLTPQVIYTIEDNALTFINEFNIYKAGDIFNGKTIANTYVGIEEQNYSRGWDSISGDVKSVVFKDEIKPTSISSWFAGFENCETMDIEKLNTENVTNMSSAFSNCSSLISLDVGHFKTDNVTAMTSMFNGCEKIETLNLTGFNTSKVTSLYRVFKDCKSLNELNLNSFNTELVTDMSGIFWGCTNLAKVDVSTFKTNNVTHMDYMFADCNSIQTIDLSNFNTENVTGMQAMFLMCKSLTDLNISNFDTSNVIDMTHMFNSCNNLEVIDVSRFNTENVENMKSMFYGCFSVRKLDVSTWKTDKVTDMSRLFGYCHNLSELNVSNFNTENVTNMFEMFSYCYSLESLDVSNFKTSKVTDMSYIFNEMHKISELNVTNFDTSSMTTIDNIFTNCGKLEKITFGDSFEFSGDTSYLPVPSDELIPGATGVWYDIATGISYIPENIPSNTAATYIAIVPSYTYNVEYKSTSGVDLGGTTVTKELGTTNIVNPIEILGYNMPESQEVTWDSVVPKTITFTYEPTKYNITINCNGGSGETSRIYTIETETFTLNTPTKDGYTFLGWTDINGVTEETVTIEKGSMGARNYTANWSANSYTYNVEYISASGIDLGGTTVTKELGTTNLIDAEEIIGYNTPESQEIKWDTIEAKTITFTYSPTEYSITINCDGGTGVSSTSYTIETETFTLGTPTREGYEFVGWMDVDGVTQATITIEKGSIGARNYTAIWSGNTYTYNIEYQSTSGIYLGGTTVTNNFGTINTITMPEIAGYDTPEPQDIAWDSIDPKTIIVMYSPTIYNVTIDCNGGDGVYDTNYTVERATFTLDTPIRSGYTFIGWTGSNGTTPEMTITIEKGETGDRNYTANWVGRAYAYNVEYVSASGIYLGGTTVEYELGTTNIVEPIEILGYDTPESQEVAWDVPSMKTITFIYEPTSYNITINCNGGSGVSHIIYNIETETFTIGTPIREGYVFEGWTDTEGVTHGSITIEKGSIGARNYTASWLGDLVIYNLIYESTSGLELYSGTIGGRLESVVEVSGDELDGYIKPAPQNIAWDSVEPKTITLIYEPIEYNVTIDCAGGTGYQSRTYTIESETFTIGTPTRTGYTFDGWLEGENTELADELVVPKGTIGDITCTAQWTANSYTYNVVYQSTSGVDLGSTTVTYNFGTTNTITAPEKIGYTTPASQSIAWDSTTAKTITFTYALTSYNITIDCAGGTGVSSTTYTIETATFTIGTPTRTGYTFLGWTGSNGTTAQTSVSIAKGSAGDKSYTAKWQVNNTLPSFTYTGNYEIVDYNGNVITTTTTGEWKIRFLTSGTLTFHDFGSATNGVDVFLVGGGGSGANFNPHSGGGGGGYTTTENCVTLQLNKGYIITIGSGGIGGDTNGSAGGSTSAFGLTVSGGSGGGGGGYMIGPLKGGNGGSGGGAGYCGGAEEMASSSAGKGGTNGNGGGGTYSGSGQGTTTREFEETSGTLYAKGGDGASSGGTMSNGTANTGNGGAGGGYSGGSGIVIIRPSATNPYFTYTGNYEIVDDNDNPISTLTGNWKIRFLTSGTLTFKNLANATNGVDAFLVGGGGGGTYYGNHSGGGGGGYTTTKKNISLALNTSYEITVGYGGSGGSTSTAGSGGSTTAFGATAAGGSGAGGGGYMVGALKGGSGGSGGGAGYCGGAEEMASSVAGKGGTDGASGGGTYAGTGQGTTTREFEETSGTLYSKGGDGATVSGGNFTNGTANTGNGGAGGGYSGASGIVIIRNKR